MASPHDLAISQHGHWLPRGHTTSKEARQKLQGFLWPPLRCLGTSLSLHSVGQAGPSSAQIQSKQDRSPPPWEMGKVTEEHATWRYYGRHLWIRQHFVPTNLFFPVKGTCAKGVGAMSTVPEVRQIWALLAAHPRASQ